jgi:hypothetical protein
MCEMIKIGLRKHFVEGTIENQRYLSCLHRYRKDAPCICGQHHRRLFFLEDLKYFNDLIAAFDAVTKAKGELNA